MAVQLYDLVHSPNFTIHNVEKRFECDIILSIMENYVNGAIIEWNRIHSTRMKTIAGIENQIREMEQCSKELEETSKIEDVQLRSQKSSEIWEKRSKIFSTSMENRKIDNDTLFLDIHSYFICCDKVQNLIEKLVKKETNNDLSELWQELKPKFKPYNDVRNHLEHIEDRIKPKYTRDMGNLSNNKFTFGGKEFDIGPDSLKFICESYERVCDILTK